ncbi:MAG: hypothetical protein WCI05_10135 [Myxococcales bacterium]
MKELATQEIVHDRGLGTAYERYCFYQQLGRWADLYDVHSVLEGPIDGMAGVSGVHGVGLALRGIPVTSVLPTASKAATARGVYARAGAKADVQVLEDLAHIEQLPKADLVIAYHALPLVDDWRSYLRCLAGRANKIVVVTVCNPSNWGVSLIRGVARLRGLTGMSPPETWRTEVLAPELWELGRVREHVYFDAPWWPDLQVSAGQTLVDRVRQLFRQEPTRVEFTAKQEGATLSERFVYGSNCWPYFGGPRWVDELLPALLRHPGFDGNTGHYLQHLAHLHGFVLDVRPRTRPARRRLALVKGGRV